MSFNLQLSHSGTASRRAVVEWCLALLCTTDASCVVADVQRSAGSKALRPDQARLPCLPIFPRFPHFSNAVNASSVAPRSSPSSTCTPDTRPSSRHQQSGWSSSKTPAASSLHLRHPIIARLCGQTHGAGHHRVDVDKLILTVVDDWTMAL
ncbi:hypothetical protein J3458_020769 [Metarhizium acridum]|uniref:uncharacterized protein n=1 Tax=Metarhizium acridum TaxID=92637 RepID=UPI001C6BF6FD|nr:hypothetical protein J3458_020769 [Metarhizium acridum]